jgi:polar amino acid transport system substrate-binding protein
MGMVLCAATAPASGQVLDRIKQSGQVRFGYVPDGRPFVYRKESGEADGYAIELCRHIAAEIKSRLALPALDVEWIPIGFDARTQQVRDGSVDVTCTPVVPTLERRREVSFSLPVFPGGNRAVIRKDSPRDLRQTLEGTASTAPVWRGSPAAKVLQRTIFAVVAGTTTEGWLKARGRMFHIDAEILDVLDYRSGLEKLLDHRVDVLFGDRAAILGEMSEAAHARLVILDRRFTHELYALPIPRNDDDFRLVVDEALSKLYASDGFGEVYAHWFKEFDDQTRLFFLWNTFPEDARHMEVTAQDHESETALAQAARAEGE